MGRLSFPIADLVIPNGQTRSNIFTREDLSHLGALTIVAPDALTGIVTVEISPLEKDVPDYADADFEILQSPPATDVAIAAARAITLFGPLAFGALRLFSAAAETAARTFRTFGGLPDPWVR